MKSARFLFPIVVCLLVVPGSAVRAEVVRWWRFEQPDVWADAAGGGRLQVPPSDAGVGAVTLSSAGLGSGFERLAAGIPNAGALGLTGRRSRVEALMPELPGRFTIECLFTPLDAAGRSAEVLIGQLAEDGAAAGSGITIQRRFAPAADEVVAGFVPGELRLTLSDGAAFTHLGSGLVPEPGADYYLAVSYDGATGEAVFRLKNLGADEGPVTVRRRAAVSAIKWVPWLMIGSGGGDDDEGFRGLIDEVRVSDTVLTPEQLLVGPDGDEQDQVAALQARVGQLEALVLQLADELGALRSTATHNGEDIAGITQVVELLSQEQGTMGRQLENLEAQVGPLSVEQEALHDRFDEVVGEFGDAIVVLEFKVMGQQELAEHLAGEMRSFRQTMQASREEWADRFAELEAYQNTVLFSLDDVERQMDGLSAGSALQLTGFEDVLIEIGERLEALEALLDQP